MAATAALGASTANAAGGGEGKAQTISNDLVKIQPADVTGTFTNPDTGKQGRMVAKFMPTEFTDESGELQVAGTLEGVFTGAKLPEGTPRHFSEDVVFDVVGSGSDAGASTAAFQSSGAAAGDFAAAGLVQAGSHGCDILNLKLGPLDLNLLGLQIDLAKVVLDIVAQPGSGALLGNLLCAVAQLLDPGSGLGNLLGGLLDSVTDLLNGLLGGDIGAVTGLLDAITGLLGAVGGAQTASA